MLIDLFFHKRTIVVLLFIAAFAIRSYHLNEPPLNFHAVRQYHSLLIARGYYYEELDSIPEWQKKVADINKQRQEGWEPPLMEFLASSVYQIVGEEGFWVPRVLSSLWWLLGGLFLYLLAQQIASPDAALFSLAFYLFLPFGVTASRSFQPESLVIMGVLASIFTIGRYYEKPSLIRLLTAAIISALAIPVKGIGLFPILSAFVFVGIHSKMYHRIFFGWRSVLFVVISLTPTIILYFFKLFISESLLSVAQGNILPHLLLYPFFWKGWMVQIGHVVGYTAFSGALLGTIMFRDGLPRSLLIGLWIGYFLFGLVFTYTIHTHDYWNLQIVPIVALALGPPVALVLHHIQQRNPLWPWRLMVAGILLMVMCLNLALARPQALDPTLHHKVKVAEEVGALVDHSTRTIFLSSDYGLPLEYHGELAGVPWPILSDLEWERLAGVKPLSAPDRFKNLFLHNPAEYFIVLDYHEYEGQADLQDFLTENFSILAQNEDYLIFDLRDKDSLDQQSHTSIGYHFTRGAIK